MKKIATIALLLASTFLVTGGAFAQSDRVNVKVPFNFTVGSTTLPAGSYAIRSVDSSSILQIENLSKTGIRVFAMSQAPGRTQVPVKTAVFRKWGTQYFLTDIRGSASSMNVHLPASRQKRDKAEHLEAEVRTGDAVLVALN